MRICAMLIELTTALFFTIGAIGGIMALKWKGNNTKPRLTDKELDQQFKKGLE